MKECVREAIADTLFNLSSTETSDGPLVQLPPPSTKLPRDKHVTSLFFFYSSLSPLS